MDAQENNFYRLIAFLIDVAPAVARYYFKRNILCGDTFESFLNNHKHILFHLMSTKQCKGVANPQRQHLSSEQFKILFSRSSSVLHRGNRECICAYNAIHNITVNILDITLIFAILQNCENLKADIVHWMTTIKDVRNTLVHSTDTKSIDNSLFDNFWNLLSGAVLGIAGNIEITPLENYKEIILVKIEYLKCRQLFSDDKIKLCQLLHEWCRERFCEMETILVQNSVLAHENQGETIRMFELLKEKIDELIQISPPKGISPKDEIPKANQPPGTKLFNVLIKMETPSDWNETNVNKYVTHLDCLLATAESNMRIISFSIEESRSRTRTVGNILPTDNTYMSELKDDRRSQSRLTSGLPNPKGPDPVLRSFYIYDENGKLYSLNFSSLRTICDLKKQIIKNEQKDLPFNGELYLYLHGVLLANDLSINDCGSVIFALWYLSKASNPTTNLFSKETRRGFFLPCRTRWMKELTDKKDLFSE